MKNFYTIILLLSVVCLNAQIDGTPVSGTEKIQKESAFQVIGENIEPSPAPPNTTATPTGSSAEVGIIEGSLSVSLSGAANYSIPIKVPPGINGVEPKLSLDYSSNGKDGSVGYGWEIAGVSSISRIPSTMFHDQIIDPVDGDDLDRFALDGQRLILKNPAAGSYLFNGAVFETENFSNIKITYFTGSPQNYFLVEYPDGSSAQYGIGLNAQNNFLYAINYWKSAQGVIINYSYTYNCTISSVTYGSTVNNSPIYAISFSYTTRLRDDFNVPLHSNLEGIYVNANGVQIRRYALEYDVANNSIINAVNLGYQRIKKITEYAGNSTSTRYNPTLFTYGNSPNLITPGSITASLSVGEIESRNAETVAGDFNGDGKMDFILYPTLAPNIRNKYWVFNDNTNSNSTLFDYRVDVPGGFDKIFSTSWLTGTSASNYKLSNQSGWCLVKTTGSTTNFTNHCWSPENILSQYTRSYTFPTYNNQLIPKQYLNGDFNGDGLTDVMIVNINDGGPTSSQAGKTYFLDLDRRITSGVNTSGNITVTNVSKYYVSDVDGDGKSDLMVFDTGVVKVYSLNASNQLILKCNYPHSNISVGADKIILLGDFNGDGNSDFIIPTAENSATWNRYFFNGTTFVFDSELFSNFTFKQSTNYSTKHYISNDFNHDGKSDIVVMAFDVATVSASSATATLKCYPNLESGFSGTSGNFYAADPVTVPYVSSQFCLPIFLSSDTPNQSLEVGFIRNSSIYTYQLKKDYNEDKLLKTITTGDGVVEAISYKPLVATTGTPNANDPKIYTTDNNSTLTYPNVDMGSSPAYNVVAKLERFGNNYKKQYFTYYGGVYNMNGLGFFGFKGVMKTNWFDPSVPGQYMVSHISRYDMNLRGANTLNFSDINYVYDFNYNPAAPISKTINTYNVVNGVFVDPLLSNKVFKLTRTSTQDFDGLKGISSETNIVYNSNNNPTNTTTLTKKGATVEHTATSTILYDSPQANPYVIDRPLNKQESVIAYGDTRTSEEQYTYTSSAPLNMVETVKKKSMGSTFITQAYEYDPINGNIKKLTLSSPDLATPRVTDYEYNATYGGRFLTKITGIDRLSTDYTYDANNGFLLTETNPYNQVTTYTYDPWGKRTSIKDYLNNTTTIAYTRTAGDTFTIDTTLPSSHGGATREVFDILGRKIISGAKDMQGVFNFVKTDYDNLSRVKKQYEPYAASGTGASQYTETTYDGYGRVSGVTSFTGKTDTIEYIGLTTTVTSIADGLTKSKSATTDAVGNTLSTTESPNGGTINHTYYANGMLKSSSYQGNVISITQDAWGRRRTMDDPSAGTYTYTYNNIGELLSEETPKGTTSYTYTDFGAIFTKTVTGKGNTNPPTTTNNVTTNLYNPTTKFLDSVSFNDIENGMVTDYTYTYNPNQQLEKVIESNPMTVFETRTIYDDLGRPFNLYQKAATKVSGTPNINKFSDKWTTNVYQNGYLYKITDGQTPTGQMRWQNTQVNARGQLTNAEFGSGITIENSYNTLGKLVSSSHKNGITDVMALTYDYTGFQQRNLLKGRTNNILGNNYFEEFDYDALDRLTSFYNELGVPETQSYKESGKIDTNSNGTYNYTDINRPYRNTSINVNPTSKAYYLNSSLQEITYNALKKPTKINQESTTGVAKEFIDFLYNVGESRSTMFYGDVTINKLQRKFRRYYDFTGTMEITEQRDPSGNVINTSFITYIGGDGYSAPVILKSDGTNQDYLYLHRDYLGSIIGISNQNKQLLERRIFDAWGNLIKLQNSSGQPVLDMGMVLIPNYTMLLDRGYTGHEHLFGIGLINMNGRLYDPKLRRFLMPDNNLQDPTNSQNYNRYGYVLNNPLKYIDPTGEDGEPPFGENPPHDGNNGQPIQNSGYYQNEFGTYSNAYQQGIASAAQTIDAHWDDWKMKDWAKQNFNFDRWSDSVKSGGNWFSKNIKSGLSDISEGLESVINTVSSWFGGGGGKRQPKVEFAQANASSFQSNGGSTLGASSRSISPGMGYNNTVELHPYVSGPVVPSMYNNFEGGDNSGMGFALAGAGVEAAGIEMYNAGSWYSIKKLKSYGQNFNGNGFTGGKNAAKLVSKRLKYTGRGLGAYNALSVWDQYINNQITTSQFFMEQGMNIFSTFGGLPGAAGGIGWEGGRMITNTNWYQNWKQNYWYAYRKEHYGY